MKNTPLAVAHACLQAYVDKDRAAIETLLDDNYHFTSPIDNSLDRAAYMEICWPNSAIMSGFDEIYAAEQGDHALIVYEAHTSTGKRFRNSEAYTVRNGKLIATEVYFGWDLPHRVDLGTHAKNDGEGHMQRTSVEAESKMLQHSDVSARLPAEDLNRAKAFYAEKLGLMPVEERPGGLRYQCGNGFFSLFHSSGKPSGDHTQMAWEVDDLRATVAELQTRGVVFEAYDLPGIKTVSGMVEVEGHYPSRGGIGERAAWFRDSEGNLLGIGQPIR